MKNGRRFVVTTYYDTRMFAWIMVVSVFVGVVTASMAMSQVRRSQSGDVSLFRLALLTASQPPIDSERNKTTDCIPVVEKPAAKPDGKSAKGAKPAAKPEKKNDPKAVAGKKDAKPCPQAPAAPTNLRVIKFD